MAITHVASITASPGAGNGTTTAIDTTGATLVVVSVSWYGPGTVPTITDSKGNAYAGTTIRTGGNVKHRYYVALAPTVGSGHTVTITSTGSYPAVIVDAFAGVGSFGDETGASTLGTTLAGGSLTPGADGALILTGLAGQSGTSASVAPSGFTVTHLAFSSGARMQGARGYLVQTTNAAINPTWTFAPSQSAAVSTLTFLPTGLLTLAVVQTAPQATAGSSGSIAVTFSTPPAIGRGVVVAVTKTGSTSNTACADNQGNTYLLAKTQVYVAATTALDIYYCAILTATGTPFTITVTGPTAARLAVALEVSGVGAGLAVDQTAGTGTSGATITAGPLAALAANEVLLVAALAVGGSAAGILVSAGWTQAAEALASTPVTAEIDHRVKGGTAGTTPSVTWAFSSSSYNSAAAIVAFYSIGPAVVTVPDVVGETEAAADTLLVAAGLVTGTVTTASSETVPAGEVISQSPSAGASVAPGSAVDLVISTGPAGPPIYVVGIGETDVVPLLATFRIQETIDAPDTMIADVASVPGPSSLSAYQAAVLTDGATAYWPLDDPSGTTARDLVGTPVVAPFVRFALGLPVVVTENGVRIFGGVVTGTRERGLTGPSATDLVVEIQATSYELSAARRVITALISQGDPPETIGGAFATLVTDYYAEVDVTLHPDQVAGPALPAATFTRSRGDAVNKHLAASVGYLQSIDFENRLRAWAPGDVLAPANYDEAVNPELLTGDITVERQLQNGYANRVILTGDGIPVPDHMDSFTGDGVADTWPITYQVEGPLPYSADNAIAFAVVEYPATSSTESIGGLETSAAIDWEYDPIALTIHRRGGPVAAGVAFNFRYHGLFIPAGTAEDAAEIAAYGLWEHVENVTAVTTTGSAQDYAEALLAAKLASKDEIVRLQTRALGFHPGQTMTIASFSRELSGDYLITQVDTGSESGGILLVRSITASKSQNNTHDWRRVYQQWAGASAKTE